MALDESKTRLLITLGRRYERLLLLAGPFLLLCLLILSIAYAASTQDDKINAKCFADAANALDANQIKLAAAWKAQKEFNKTFPNVLEVLKQKPTPDQWYSQYWYVVSTTILDSTTLDCSNFIVEKKAYFGLRSPSDLVKDFRNEAKSLTAAPFQVHGIEIPEYVVVNVLGTNIGVDAVALTQILQISLLPLLLIWLGSIFNTRYRETLLIASASHIYDLYPHIVNIFPTDVFWPTRRIPPFSTRGRRVAYIWCGFVRACLVLLFIATPIFFYLLGLYLSPALGSAIASFLAGGVVCVFGLGTLVIEFFPWHSVNIFQEKVDPNI